MLKQGQGTGEETGEEMLYLMKEATLLGLVYTVYKECLRGEEKS